MVIDGKYIWGLYKFEMAQKDVDVGEFNDLDESDQEAWEAVAIMIGRNLVGGS